MISDLTRLNALTRLTLESNFQRELLMNSVMSFRLKDNLELKVTKPNSRSEHHESLHGLAKLQVLTRQKRIAIYYNKYYPE